MTVVLIRVAGGKRRGFGHLRRCWTLADRLQAGGAAVRFVATSEEGRAVTASAGFAAGAEAGPGSIGATMDALRAGEAPRLLVVDDPELSGAALGSLRAVAPVACFDDAAHRPLHVDLVVNGSAGAEDLAYRGAPQTRFLLGPRYIVLRAAFAGVPERTIAATVRRVLLLTGGADAGGMTAPLLRTVLETLGDASVDVVTGPFATPPSFEGMAPRMRARVQVHHVPEDMATLMRSADLAVSGGGQTAYELAATGTPTIGIRLAADQVLNLHGLAAAGCLRDAGAPADPGFDARLIAALSTLVADAAARAEMSRRGRALVDGRGAERVADRIARLAGVLVA